MKLTNKQLKIRLIQSLAAGLGAVILFGVGFYKISNGPTDDELASPLRKVFRLNESIWSSFYSTLRLSPKEKLSPGKRPRVNGALGLESQTDLANFTVEVDSGEQKLLLPMSAFQSLPKADYSTRFKCIEGWSEVIQYNGVRFSDFMKAYRVGQKSDGSYYRYVGLVTPDEEYYVSIDMDSMLHPQTVLAYEMNEAPLDLKNGAPLRLVIPIKYGIKSLKRIGKIFFSDEKPADYWAEQGYDWWAGL